MDIVIRPNQTLDHELLGVEAIEDIIDVENEMGFGEGEDWGHEENVGYGKLASLKRVPHKASVYIRSRSNPPSRRHRAVEDGVRGRQQLKPLSVRHGVKHVVSSPSGGDEKPKMPVTVRHGVNHVVSSSSNDDEKPKMKAGSAAQEARKDKNDIPRQPGEEEVDSKLLMQHPRDLDNMQDSGTETDFSSYSPRASNHGGINGGEEGDSMLDARGASKEKEHEHKHDHGHEQALELKPADMEKLQEKAGNSNRVRFSLDLETGEKVMGYTNKKGGDLKERAKGCGQQEHPWRYGRAPQGESPGYATDKGPVGLARAASTQRRKEPNIRENQKDSSFDLERSIEMREDKKAIRLAQERIERLEDALLKQQDIVANMRLSLAHEGVKDYGKLRQLLDALDRNIKKLTISKSRHVPESYQLKSRAEQIDRLKAQCNLLETDRERLKKKLRLLIENAKGKERELEALTTERERLLECKVRELESSLEDWESKFRKVEAEFAMERGIWEENLSVCKLDWKNKKQRWATKWKEKEIEISNLKSSQARLIDSLVSCRQCVDKLKRVATSYKGDLKEQGTSGRVEGDALVGEYEERSPSCSEEIDALELAHSIQTDTESLRKLLEESSLVLQREPRFQSEALREESQILENKVSQTLSLMDELKQEMKAKEDQIKKENENYAQVVAEKVKQVEALEKQLVEKEHDMGAFMQELKDEVSLLNTELERERNERSQLSDMQGDVKHRLMKGVRKREQKWEEELEVLKGKLDEMTAAIALKDERIELLEEEVQEKATQLAQEKQKWNMAIKEVKQKAAKTILRFVHGKENGLLEHLRERRKGCKTGEDRTGFTCKTDEDEHHTCMYQETFRNESMRDHFHSKRHHVKARSTNLGSPRESQHSSKHGTESEKLAVHEDLGKSLELHKAKVKQDWESRRRKEKAVAQAYCIEEEFYPKGFKRDGKNRALEKQDVLKILERKKGSGDNTFTLLQGTVQDLE